jgi:lysozyme
MPVKGIDVSAWQGDFNWAAWKGAISFGSTKATESNNFQDPTFAANWERMKTLDVFRFAYHFAHADVPSVDQSGFFCETVKKQGLLPSDNFVLDLEASYSMTPSYVAAWAIDWIHEVEKILPGHRILVYTYPYFAEEGYCAGLEKHDLWIANYDVNQPTVPKPWKSWTFWQNVGTGLDRDIFNGTQAELEKFCTLV